MINPPQEVLYQALLYWDKIATVVPEENTIFDDSYRQYLNESMLEVADAGLYWPVSPPYKTSDFDVAVLGLEELLENIPADDLMPPARATEDRQRSTVLRSKFGNDYSDRLIARGLARESDENGTLLISPTLQLLLIGVAAGVLADRQSRTEYGRQDEHGLRSWSVGTTLYPHTDQISAYRAACQPYVAASKGTGRTWPCWQLELGDLLPVPATGTPVAEVLAFRTRYEDERRRMVRAVESLISAVRAHYHRPDEVFPIVRDELTSAVSDLSQAAKKSRINWIRRSVYVMVALGSAAAGAAIVPELGWLLGTASGLAINVATGEMRAKTSRWPNMDLSYLHRLGKAADTSL